MTTLAVGTDKGLFTFDNRDGTWAPGTPQFLGWRVTALGRDTDDAYLLGTGSGWFGPAIHRSDDLRDWKQLTPGPQYPEGGRTLEQIWKLAPAGDALWIGVAEAGLFRSHDGGASCEPVTGLNDHPSSEAWGPGAGGLCAHALLFDAADPDRIWCGISAVGVFRSDDGGDTWQLRNRGIAGSAPDDTPHDVGYCVHGLAADPADADTIYRQDHSGVYRTTDGADTWERTEQGLPANFGFPAVMDTGSGRVFLAPQHSDGQRVPVDGRFGIYRSDDGGDTWALSGEGWPSGPRWSGVLRGAMATDHDGTVAAGTTCGELWVTTDAGDHWEALDVTLPRIHAVALF